MKKITCFFIILFNVIANYCIAQFVTLEGRQFKLNGDNFYPMVLNYTFCFTQFGNDPLCISPDAHYDSNPNVAFEYTDCANLSLQIKQHFLKIKSMGFNAVRVGAGIAFRDSSDDAPGYYGLAYNVYYTPINFQTDHYVQKISRPYLTNIHLLEAFGLLNEILHQASDVGLKVIFIINGGAINKDDQRIADCIEYLEAVATYMSTSQYADALMAYDLYNEPAYGRVRNGIANTQNSHDYSKYEICAFENACYHALKDNDSVHLVTLGGIGLDDLWQWDPGILKLDFYSLHSYPLARVDNPNFSYNWDAEQGVFTWFKNNCPIPWIIGETGFAADDRTTSVFSNLNNPIAHQVPNMWGTESDQSFFATESLKKVRNCNASGYSWWQYQNVQYYSGFGNDYCNNVLGLLYHGLYSSPGIEKPCVSIFRNYLNNSGTPPLMDESQCQISSVNNYYDPCRNTINSTASPQVVTGTVNWLDANNVEHPLQDALVKGYTFMKSVFNPINQKYEHTDNIFYTFTDNQGHFSLTPYDYLHPNLQAHQWIRFLTVTGMGSSTEQYNYWEWTGMYSGTIPTISVPSISDFTINSGKVLKKININIDEVVQNINITTGQADYFQAYHNLAVSPGNASVVINAGGTADFKALNEINVLQGFHAQTTSEVLLHIDPVEMDCGLITSANPPNGFKKRDILSLNSTLELIFNKSNENNDFIIVPNPTNGFFNLKFFNKILENREIIIFNSVGVICFQTTSRDLNLTIDFSHQPKGIYLVKTISNNKSLIKKIIIN